MTLSNFINVLTTAPEFCLLQFAKRKKLVPFPTYHGSSLVVVIDVGHFTVEDLVNRKAYLSKHSVLRDQNGTAFAYPRSRASSGEKSSV